MKEKLQAKPCLTARRMYTGLYIFFLMICGAAHSQPTMLSSISSQSKNFVYVNGSLYYSAADNLYRAMPASSPTLVKTTGETILRIYNIVLGSNFFFVTQSSAGQTLWRSDGTAANTVHVTTAMEIIPLLVYNSELFLRINSAATGMELWKMDPAYNVALLKDINPGAADGFIGLPGSLIIHNNLLYFLANDGTEENLWRSNGNTAGTVLSADLDDTEVYNPSQFSGLTSYNSALYFTRNHEDPEWGDRIAELWKSDGTTEGTSILVTYGKGNSWNYISNFIVFEGKLYFFHGIGDPPYVWFSVTDGTASGTQHLEEVTIDGDLLDLVDAEEYLLYYASTQGFVLPLQKFDGTTTSTVYAFYEGDDARKEVIDLTYTEGRAFFTAYSDTYNYPQADRQLFQADLASGNTRPVTEIFDSVSYYGSGNITAADGSIFFTRQVSGQMSLWYYDPDSSPPTCEGTGNIVQEIWTNVPGTDVRMFDFSTPPTGESRSFNSFETSQYYTNNYASRIRSMICVPQSGRYTFWISSDDQSELYLSTDSFEENKRLIAWVYGHTPFRNYDKYPSQKSWEISLEAGRKYYIEVRHKEGNGNDFISVGWTLPDGTMQRPIPGDRLTEITTPPNQPPVITITSPQPDQNFPAGSSVTISANVTDPDGVSSVLFRHVYSSGYTTLASFTSAPYEYQWNDVPSGTQQILVIASDPWGAKSSESVYFTVEEPPCTGTGTIVREIWTGISGTSVSSIPVNSPPNTTVELTGLSTPNYYGNDYGSRIRGYVCVPETGAYTFWIAGDDNCELWLSNNDDPAGKSKIAYVSGHTRVNEWTKYSTQQSALVNLVQGQRYYIEVLHKEGNGADHVEVGWQLPSGTFERPVTGNRLIPFDDPSTSAARFAVDDVFSFEEEGTVSISPNPVISGKQVSINLPGAGDEEVHIDIKSITGVSVQNEILSSHGDAVVLDLNPSLTAGMYLIRVSNDSKRWSTKLQVK